VRTWSSDSCTGDVVASRLIQAGSCIQRRRRLFARQRGVRGDGTQPTIHFVFDALSSPRRSCWRNWVGCPSRRPPECGPVSNREFVVPRHGSSSSCCLRPTVVVSSGFGALRARVPCQICVTFNEALNVQTTARRDETIRDSGPSRLIPWHVCKKLVQTAFKRRPGVY